MPTPESLAEQFEALRPLCAQAEAVGPHDASVTHSRSVLKSRFLTSQPHVHRGAMEAVDGMTPTTNQLGT